MVLAIVPLAAEYRRQLIDNPPSEPAPDFEDWVDDKSKASKSQTSDTRTLARKRPRLEDPEDAGEREVPFEAIPHQIREVKRSSPPEDSSGEVGVAERKLGDIQNLPEMSSYYKCWRYVQSLPSGI
ncbi:hypothetical protein FS749_014917 [Ceratobasidium sp. UAMH 11750]|nr:hypothetical protein FS749_014917 [Ceratobasidium sp. UAMH 11750]